MGQKTVKKKKRQGGAKDNGKACKKITKGKGLKHVL